MLQVKIPWPSASAGSRTRGAVFQRHDVLLDSSPDQRQIGDFRWVSTHSAQTEGLQRNGFPISSVGLEPEMELQGSCEDEQGAQRKSIKFLCGHRA